MRLTFGCPEKRRVEMKFLITKKIAELKASRKQTAKATVATTAKSAKAAATSTSTSTRPPTSTKASKGQAPIVSISSQRIRDNSKQGGK
ncbi:hypothetical protein ABKV19_013516 [Rosa sericea]